MFCVLLRTVHRRFHFGFLNTIRSISDHSDAVHSSLRKLYKRAHPDLLTGYPAERRANESAMQTISQFLAEWQSSNPSKRVFPISIYLLPSPVSERDLYLDVASDKSLKHVQLEMKLSHPMQKAGLDGLRKLFNECGVEFAVGNASHHEQKKRVSTSFTNIRRSLDELMNEYMRNNAVFHSNESVCICMIA